MKKLAELLQERAAKVKAQKGLLDKRKAEKRDFSEEEKKEFRTFTTDIEALDALIEERKEEDAAELRAANLAATPVNVNVVDGEEKERKSIMKRYSFHKAIRSQMPNHSLDGAELEVHQETMKRAKEAGVSITGVAIPAASNTEKRADGHTVTQDSGANGANLVAEELGSPIELLRPKPILESLGARFISGLQGDIAFPTNDGGISATWEGEVATVSPTKNAIGKKTMKPNRLAVHTLISLQNLFQSSTDLERFTVEDINAVVGNEFDAKSINGSGSSNQPLGILNTAGVNVISTGTNGGAPTWKGIVDMESEVFIANANAARMAYLMNPGTKGFLKTTKHSAGDLNYLMGMDNTVNGYSAGISNLIPNDLTKGTGTALNAAVFGDFSQLIMGQWGFYDLTVDNVSRKVDGYVALIVNTFLDCLVRQDKAFSVVKDWDIS